MAESHRRLNEHAKQIKSERDTHEAKCADAWAAIKTRDDESVKKAEELRVGLAEVEWLKSKYEAKFALYKQAEALN